MAMPLRKTCAPAAGNVDVKVMTPPLVTSASDPVNPSRRRNAALDHVIA
jgi:hypothetical protein